MGAVDQRADETYARLLPSLQGWVGWFVVIRGDRMGGVFPTYLAAAHGWMALYGPVPALIRRVGRLPAAEAANATAADRAATGPWVVPPAQPQLAAAFKWTVFGQVAQPRDGYAA